MARQVTTEIIDTAEGRRLVIREVHARQQEVDVDALRRIVANLDRRLTAQQAETARLRAEREDLAAKLAELEALGAPDGAAEPAGPARAE